MATRLHSIVLGGLLIGVLDIVAAFVMRNAFGTFDGDGTERSSSKIHWSPR